MDDIPPSPSSPLISTSKQNRILIWRNEVASASASYTASTRSAPSLITATTTATTTTASSTSISTSELATMSRRSRLWYRIKTHISGKLRRRSSAGGHELPGFMMPPRKDEPVPRTAMYQSLQSGEAGDEELSPVEGSSRGRGTGLLDKQERLRRASRLLHNA